MPTHKSAISSRVREQPENDSGMLHRATSEQSPPRWKMFLLTFPAAYILSTIIVIPLLTLLPTWPFIAINLIVNLLLAFLLTYIGLPLLTHLFHTWLYANVHRRNR